MQDLINEIMTKAIEINNNTKSTIFVYYMGHVKSLEVFIYIDGLGEYKGHDIYKLIYLDENNAIEDLKHVLEELKKLG